MADALIITPSYSQRIEDGKNEKSNKEQKTGYFKPKV